MLVLAYRKMGPGKACGTKSLPDRASDEEISNIIRQIAECHKVDTTVMSVVYCGHKSLGLVMEGQFPSGEFKVI